MNRAVLIVICDFLVSAMLSMMTGMVPAHTGGTGVGLDENTTKILLSELDLHRRELEKARLRLRQVVEKMGSTPEREAEMHRLAGEIANLIAQRAKITALQERNQENTGKLSPEELQRRLDEEIKHRLRSEIEAKGRQEDLELVREKLSVASKELSSVKENLRQTNTSLQKTASALVDLSKEHTKTISEKAATEADLRTKQRQLQERESDLSGAREALKEINARYGQAKTESRKLQNTLAFQTGKLNTTEQELAMLQGNLNRVRKQLSTKELERNEALRQKQELELLVKRTVEDLSRTRSELRQERENFQKQREQAAVKVATLDAKLSAANLRLSEVPRELRNDVLSSYSAAVVKLNVLLSEKRFVEEQTGGGTYFMPLVEFGNSTFVVGGFSQLAGDAEQPMRFSRITKIGYLAENPQKNMVAAETVAGPLLVYSGDLRVAALRYRTIGRKPLKLLTFEMLKKRGWDNLYLFKCKSFGRDSAEITGRCSVDLSSAMPYLFIRNAGRGAGSELRAEAGDYVLTREGHFVGVVVREDTKDFGRIHQVRVAIFTDNFAWNRASAISLDKPEKAPYYQLFGERIQAIKNKIADIKLDK